MAQLQSLADAPNTLREYETIYILKPDTVNEQVGEVNERVKGIIESKGGKVLSVDNWGKRKLAYEIRKQLKGIYLYWQYLASPDVVAEFERNMRMLDPVIRYMTIQVDQDIDASARDSQIDEQSYERASTTAADEEELMLGRGPSDSYSAFDRDDDDDDDDDDDMRTRRSDRASDEDKSDEGKSDEGKSDEDQTDEEEE